MKTLNEVFCCPNCNTEVKFLLDGFGHTPCHLHCDVCKINIGATSFGKTYELLLEYNKPSTYIEYYNNEIKYMVEDGKEIINKE